MINCIIMPAGLSLWSLFVDFSHTRQLLNVLSIQKSCHIASLLTTVFAAATVVAVEDAKRVVLASTTAPFGVPDNHLKTEVTARLPDPLFDGWSHVDSDPAWLARCWQRHRSHQSSTTFAHRTHDVSDEQWLCNDSASLRVRQQSVKMSTFLWHLTNLRFLALTLSVRPSHLTARAFGRADNSENIVVFRSYRTRGQVERHRAV